MAKDSLNPRTTHFEFGGPIGAAFMTISLPITVYALYFFCNKEQCTPLRLPTLPAWQTFINLEAFGVVIGWFLFQALLQIVVPGPIVKGLELRNGKRLSYHMNGMAVFIISISLALAMQFSGFINLAYLYDHFLHICTATIVLSFVLAVFVYVKSFDKGALLALGGNSGVGIYDFFIGRELNPRIGSFDIKLFCELRPGLIGWVLINFGMAAKQFQLQGHIDDSMLLVNVFQFIYVFDAFQSEPAILSTMDIIMDGFGLMLSFGDLAWVPCTYSLQARFLVDYPIDLPTIGVIGIVLLKALGYMMFRGANSQKDRFKRNPEADEFKDATVVTTDTGRRLLASGWWGLSRHPNYFGDILMAFAWSLPCGWSPLCYFYPVYFCVLLVHRQMRDEHKCANSYGAAWKTYCRLVPYRIVPGIY